MSLDTEAPRSGTLFVIAAASGTGKTSLLSAVLDALPEIKLSISYTTRAPRRGEVHAQHYFFIDQPRFDDMIREGAFLEHARVFGKSYGTAKATVVDALGAGQDIVLEIDWQGAAQIREQIPDCRSIFILPPSRATLLGRLQDRGKDSAEEIERRLAEAKEEMSHCRDFDYLVINDHFDQAAQELIHIFSACRLASAKQAARHSQLLEDLLA